jgi:hypothetical protein
MFGDILLSEFHSATVPSIQGTLMTSEMAAAGQLADPSTFGERGNQIYHIVSRFYLRQTMTLCALALAGCGALEPMVEPEVHDLQQTVETLKSQLRDTEGTIKELRKEVDETHVVRDQLEGRTQEAERRLAEARRVIDLQRKEVMAAKDDRVRISRTIFLLQGQLKELQKQIANSGVHPRGSQHLASASGSNDKSMTRTAEFVGKPGADFHTEDHRVKGVPVRGVTVKAGDTLYRIGRTHKVPVERLKSLNDLTENTLEVGQNIWVPSDR